MEAPDYNQLRQVYSERTDEELLRLALEIGELTSQAQEALRFEMQQRKLEDQDTFSEIIKEAPKSPLNVKVHKTSWLNWIWPSVTNESEAKNAAKSGAGGAIFVTVCTGGLAILAMINGRSYAGIDAYGLVDAILFALIAWRIFRYSFYWASFGLLLWLGEVYEKLHNNPRQIGVITVIITLGFVASIRGTYFLRNKRKNEKVSKETTIVSTDNATQPGSYADVDVSFKK